MFLYYIAKAASNMGLIATREIYEKAIESLPNQFAKIICLKYAQMELKLGEIDRTRSIYAYASQFCDPRVIPMMLIVFIGSRMWNSGLFGMILKSNSGMKIRSKKCYASNVVLKHFVIRRYNNTFYSGRQVISMLNWLNLTSMILILLGS